MTRRAIGVEDQDEGGALGRGLLARRLVLDRRSDLVREFVWSPFGVVKTAIGECAPCVALSPRYLDFKLAVAGAREGVDVIDTCLEFKASQVVAARAEGFSQRATYLQYISLVFGRRPLEALFIAVRAGVTCRPELDGPTRIDSESP
jgi:hypothetical protein